MGKQRGITLTNALIGMVVLAFAALFFAKLLPSYIEYFSVKKILSAIEASGESKGTVRDIRLAFDRRNQIENVQSVRSDDLEITKEGGEAVISASWSVKVPLVYNLSACVDFNVTTAK